MTFVLRLLGQLSDRDRGLYARWSLSPESHRVLRDAWLAITHAGGALVSMASVVVPLWLGSWRRSARGA